MLSNRLNSAFLYLYTAISKFVVFSFNIVVARYAGIDIYGQYAFYRSVATQVETFVSSSINPFVVKNDISDHRENQTEDFVKIITIVLVACLAAIVILLMFERFHIFKELDELFVFFILVFYMSSSLLNGIFASINLARSKNIHSFISSLFSFLFFAIIFLVLYFSDVTITPVRAIVALSIMITIEMAIKYALNSSFQLKSSRYFDFSTYWMAIRGVFSQSKYVMFSTAVSSVFFIAIRVMIVKPEYGGSSSEMAVFDVYFQYLMIYTIIFTVFVSLKYARLCRNEGNDNGRYLSAYILPCTTFAVVLSLVLLLGFETFYKLYGFSESGVSLWEMFILTTSFGLALTINRFSIYISETKFLLYVAIVSAVVCILIFGQIAATAATGVTILTCYYTISVGVYICLFVKRRVRSYVRS